MGRQLTDQEEAQITQYVTDSNQKLAAAQQKIASLQGQLQQKEAAAAPEAFHFDESAVADALDKIAAAGLTTQDALPALKQEIQSNPNAVLGYLGKIAEHVTRPAKPMGYVEKVASGNSQSVNPNSASDAAWANLMSQIS
jgi:hypothetical protein